MLYTTISITITNTITITGGPRRAQERNYFPNLVLAFLILGGPPKLIRCSDYNRTEENMIAILQSNKSDILQYNKKEHDRIE